MSILTDLEAALWAALASGQTKGKVWDDLHALLTDDTIAALVAVARAMHDENNSSGEAARQAYVRGRTALALLVKEADDE